MPGINTNACLPTAPPLLAIHVVRTKNKKTNSASSRFYYSNSLLFSCLLFFIFGESFSLIKAQLRVEIWNLVLILGIGAAVMLAGDGFVLAGLWGLVNIRSQLPSPCKLHVWSSSVLWLGALRWAMKMSSTMSQLANSALLITSSWNSCKHGQHSGAWHCSRHGRKETKQLPQSAFRNVSPRQ